MHQGLPVANSGPSGPQCSRDPEMAPGKAQMWGEKRSFRSAGAPSALLMPHNVAKLHSRLRI